MEVEAYQSVYLPNFPPLGWGCRCEVIQLPGKNHKETPDASFQKPDVPPQFRENFGKKQQLFSDKHPYYQNKCQGCTKTAKLATENNLQCQACLKAMEQCKEHIKIQQQFQALPKKYDPNKWFIEYISETGGYIVSEEGHGKDEKVQNIRSAKPLARKGFMVELIRQQTIRKNGKKKHITTRDANVNDEKWEFKYTKDYKNLAKSIGTKAGQVIEQGADVLLIDIVKTKVYGKNLVILGVKNSFKYNPSLKKICVMIESEDFKIIERKDYQDGTYILDIKKWLPE